MSKEVLEKTEVGKLELNFSHDTQGSVLKVGVNQAVILMPRSKTYPNSYVTGWATLALFTCQTMCIYTCAANYRQ